MIIKRGSRSGGREILQKELGKGVGREGEADDEVSIEGTWSPSSCSNSANI